MKIYDSKIKTQKERKLFSSVIIKICSDIADKRRTIKATYGNNIVIFIDKRKRENRYSLNNSTLSQANKCFDILAKLIDNAQNNISSYINSDFLTVDQIEEIQKKWFEIFNSKENKGVVEINSYGFERNKIEKNDYSISVLEMYLQYDKGSIRKILRFTFKSNLLIWFMVFDFEDHLNVLDIKTIIGGLKVSN